MLGFNGGLMGVRRTPTTDTASGLWFQNEQSVAHRAGIWPSVQATDPDFASVSLLLHMDGSNGSTTFTDSSSNALTVTANGNAQISTAQSKFGGASGLFDGSGDFLSFPSISIGTSEDVTLECWFRAASTSNLALFGDASGDNIQTFAILSGILYAFWDGNEVEAGAVSADTWHHGAITRQSGTIRIFLDGTLVDSSAGNTRALLINRVGRCVNRNDFNGYIDDVRITKGVARYTASFTAPTAPFPDA
jgi:hypothetical protein